MGPSDAYACAGKLQRPGFLVRLTMTREGPQEFEPRHRATLSQPPRPERRVCLQSAGGGHEAWLASAIEAVKKHVAARKAA